jgi:hypothetical protein
MCSPNTELSPVATKPEPENQRDQNENQLAGVEVAEQSQAQRDRLGQQGDQFQQQVEGHDQRPDDFRHAELPRVQRVHHQLAKEAAQALEAQRVNDDQHEYREGHAHGGVDVGGGHHLLMMDARLTCYPGQPVDWDQVHEIHEENPYEQGQRQRRDQAAGAMEGLAHAAVDELDDGFDKGLNATARGVACL